MLQLLPTDALSLIDAFLGCQEKTRLRMISKELSRLPEADPFYSNHFVPNSKFKWLPCHGNNTVMTGLATAMQLPIKEHWVNPAVACGTCRHYLPQDAYLLPYLACHFDAEERNDMGNDHCCPRFNLLPEGEAILAWDQVRKGGGGYAGLAPLLRSRAPYSYVREGDNYRLLLLEVPIVTEVIYRENGSFHKKTFAVCSPRCYQNCTKPEINNFTEGFVKVGTMVTEVVKMSQESPLATAVRLQRMVSHSSNFVVTSNHAGSGLQLGLAIQSWQPLHSFHKLVHLSHPSAFLIRKDDVSFLRRSQEFSMIRATSSERDIRWLTPYHHISQEVMADGDIPLLSRCADFMNETNQAAIQHLGVRPPYSPRLGTFHDYQYSLTTTYFEDDEGEGEWGLHSLVNTEETGLQPQAVMEVHEANLLYRLTEGMVTFSGDELFLTLQSLDEEHFRSVVYERPVMEEDLLSDETLSDEERMWDSTDMEEEDDD